MIQRIIEAFTKGYAEMTMIDCLIILIILSAVFFVGYIIYGIYFWIRYERDKKVNK